MLLVAVKYLDVQCSVCCSRAGFATAPGTLFCSLRPREEGRREIHESGRIIILEPASRRTLFPP